MTVDKNGIRELHKKVVVLAESIKGDKGDFLDTIVQLNAVRFDIAAHGIDDDFMVFVDLVDRTDHMPLADYLANEFIKAHEDPYAITHISNRVEIWSDFAEQNF